MADHLQLDDPSNLRKSLMDSFGKFEASFRADHPQFWWLTLTAPVFATALILLTVSLIWGWDLAGKFAFWSVMTFFVFGRFVILTGNEGEVQQAYADYTLEPEQLFAMLTYMDFMVALFVTFHMGALFRIPWVGHKIAALVWDGKFLMDKQPWLRKLAFFGLVGFVIFPTSTTGSIGGSIFGRLLGLSRVLTVTGVLLGSMIGNAIMYFFAKEINQFVDKDTVWLKVVGIVLLIGFVVLAELRYQHIKRRYFKSSSGIDITRDDAQGDTDQTDDVDRTMKIVDDSKTVISKE